MSAPDIMDMPAMTPPPGEVANFDSPPNQNTMALAIMSVCLAVSTLAIALRLYSRWAIVKIGQWQDYLLLASFGIYLAILVVLYRLSNKPGWFIHLWNLHVRDMVDFLHVVVISMYLFLSILIPLKTAILVEWIHIFLPDGGHRRNLFFWMCHFVIWANIIFCIIMIIVFSLSCVPHEYLWNHTIEDGYCRINTAYVSLSTACFVFSTDIIILFIPQRVIWKLNMRLSRKVGISFVFALGMAACAASIVRLYYTVERARSADVTYDISSLMLTAVGESACAVLVLCVPAVPKALAGFKSHLLPSWKSLASVVSYNPSSETRKKKYTGDGAGAWPASADEEYKRHWQIASGSERSLVPLERIHSAKHHDPELGNAIYCVTEFEAKTSYDPDRTILLEQRSRQHPWMQK